MDQLEWFAAQAGVIHTEDSTMRLLERPDFRLERKDRRGVHTSGIVARSLVGDQPRAVDLCHLDGALPTSNSAERSIRKTVLWRKVSLGVDSGDGARFVERMLTRAGTARKRSLDPLKWLTQALQAKLENRPVPAFQVR